MIVALAGLALATVSGITEISWGTLSACRPNRVVVALSALHVAVARTINVVGHDKIFWTVAMLVAATVDSAVCSSPSRVAGTLKRGGTRCAFAAFRGARIARCSRLHSSNIKLWNVAGHTLAFVRSWIKVDAS